ncbi:MAG: hypothetical protein KME38_30875 [Spirirestis rafaelensis WJT71-NPBG6]|jgi:hypothetical protein|nr:hypothetical protein [Spirirestis rafaelensis WJT71-NPBG6]
MQLSTNVQSDITKLSFQSLLLEEFLLEPNLRREFGVSEKLAELALRFSDQAAKILHLLIVSKASLPIPPDVIKEVVGWLASQRHTTLIFRSIADVLATARSAQDKYNSCCRSAICHAVVGSYDFAFGALRISASVNDSWARHHHIYGLIHGIENRKAQAQYEFEIAYAYEPYSETKVRIAQALFALSQTTG